MGTPATIYYDKDASFDPLKGKKIVIFGYGSQGHAHALNLKDSGCDVSVALRAGSDRIARAEAGGFKVHTDFAAAAQSADVVMILLPDENHKALYDDYLEKNLKKGAALFFAHGFNIHFGRIAPRADLDVLLIAPKGPGHLVRSQFQGGGGVPALIAIHQNATGKAKEIGLAYAKGVGGTKGGVIETTFKEETETDLFGEQVVLCGGLSELIRAGFDTLVEAGYQPEVAYFECLHEVKLIVDLIFAGGISNMRYSISNTARYGDVSRGRRVVNASTRTEMKKILGEIQNGTFAKEYIDEYEKGSPNFKAMVEKDAAHPIEQVGERLRAMMPWVGKKASE